MDSTRNRRTFAVGLATAALAGGTLLASALPASAATSDDPRALAFDGNAKTCEDAGLSGELLSQGDVDYSISDGGRLLTVTAENNGVFVTGFVVKGGPGYNVYEPGERGLSWNPPWEDMRSPFNRGGKIPQISHWFACGDRSYEGGS